MSEMVERVARALMAVSSQHDSGDLKIKHHYEMARVAIAAMREPTDDMKAAEVDGEHVHWDYPCQMCGGLRFGWQAMIDKALS